MSIRSNINEGIKAVLIFKRKDFTRTKSTKSTKRIKSIKRKQATFTQTFFTHRKSITSIKSTKNTKCQTSHFLFLECFYAHKNAVFFCLTHKKAQKAHRKHKNANKRIGDFFPLDVFFKRI